MGEMTTHRSPDDGAWVLPLARYGLREVALITVVAAALATAAVLWWWPGLVPVGLLWLAGVLFFRDPPRTVPEDPQAWLSPADGTVTEVTRIEHDDRIGGPAVRIGIFLSVFNVHLNRSPCDGVVRSITYRRGSYHDARNPRASTENEANALILDAGRDLGPVVVTQIAGLIARRIVCAARVGDFLAAGQRYGMIKFGSRTELVLARPDEVDVSVRVGDKVRAGATVVARRRKDR